MAKANKSEKPMLYGHAVRWGEEAERLDSQADQLEQGQFLDLADELRAAAAVLRQCASSARTMAREAE